ncbi:MAG: hypothetical protein IKB93_00695 [Clostridia bacterium]|nr:hypothetical protein [Clostridia bacterium]
MKKIISILAVLTMLFSVFAMVPAYAATLEGTFNVKSDSDGVAPKAISTTQELYFNLKEALTDEEKASIDIEATGNYYNLKANSGTPTISGSALSATFTCEVMPGNKAIKIIPMKNAERTWTTGAGGTQWNVTLTVGDKTASTMFNVNPTKSLNGTNTTLKSTGMVDIATDKEFKIYFTNKLFASRGESFGIEITTEDGEEYTDFIISNLSSDYYYFTFKPKTAWTPGTTYSVIIKTYSDWGFTPDGEPERVVTKEWTARTFTTAGEKPVAPAEDYTYAVTKDNSTYTVNVTANKETKSAMIVLIGKNDSTGLIGSVKAVNPFTLTKGTPASERITIASGETFYAYLWENGTMVPIRNVITEADITQ